MGALEMREVVGVVAPSDGVRDDKNDIYKSRTLVREWGLRPKFAPGMFKQIHDFSAGTEADRFGQLGWLVSQGLRFCFMAEGGYALDHLFFPEKNYIKTKKLLENWEGMFMGYSDIGWLACAAFMLGKPSIHGPNFAWLHKWDRKTKEMTRKILMENEVWKIDKNFNWSVGVEGCAKGTVIVGNMEVLDGQLSTSTDWMGNTRDIILCIEENELSAQDILRKLRKFLRHVDSTAVKGLIFGKVTKVKNNDYPVFSKHESLRTQIVGIVTDFSGRKKIPVAFMDDFGHMGDGYESETADTGKRQTPMIFGAEAELEVSKKGCSLCYREPLWK